MTDSLHMSGLVAIRRCNEAASSLAILFSRCCRADKSDPETNASTGGQIVVFVKYFIIDGLL